MPSIGQVVARLRRRKGWSQDKLQEISGGKIKSRWVASLETGRIKHSDPEKLEILASYLDTTVLDIYEQAGVIHFPPKRDYQTAREQNLIEEFRRLPPDVQETVYQMVHRLGHRPEAEFSPELEEHLGLSKSPKSKSRDNEVTE